MQTRGTDLSTLIDRITLYDEEPVLRGGADDAFLAWSEGRDVDDDAWADTKTRCVLPDADPFWEEISAGARLECILKPHRTESTDGMTEHLVNSIRPFTCLVSIVDPASDRAISGWRTALRATLVYADTHEPVPPQRGELPLSGETCKVLEPTGEACALRLRIAALSYNHNRRAFAVRIEADELPGGRSRVSAMSAPLRSVARLPNATASARVTAEPNTAGAAQPQPQHCSTSTPMDLAGRTHPVPPAIPTVPIVYRPSVGPIVVDAADLDDEAGWETDDDDDIAMGCHGSLGAPPPPNSASEGRSMGDERAAARARSLLGPPPPPLQPCLLDELRAQGELLQLALSQQQRIMSEMRMLQASTPLALSAQLA